MHHLKIPWKWLIMALIIYSHLLGYENYCWRHNSSSFWFMTKFKMQPPYACLFDCIRQHTNRTWQIAAGKRTFISFEFYLGFVRKCSPLLLIESFKAETHRTRFDNAARFFRFWKLIEQPVKGNFKRCVDPITQNVIKLLNIWKT